MLVPMTGTAEPSSPPTNPPRVDPAELFAFSFIDFTASFPLKISKAVPTAKETKPEIKLAFAKFVALLAKVLKRVDRTFLDTTVYVILAVAFVFRAITD